MNRHEILGYNNRSLSGLQISTDTYDIDICEEAQAYVDIRATAVAFLSRCQTACS